MKNKYIQKIRPHIRTEHRTQFALKNKRKYIVKVNMSNMMYPS